MQKILYRAFKKNAVGLWSDHFYTTSKTEMKDFMDNKKYVMEGKILYLKFRSNLKGVLFKRETISGER